MVGNEVCQVFRSLETYGNEENLHLEETNRSGVNKPILKDSIGAEAQ